MTAARSVERYSGRFENSCTGRPAVVGVMAMSQYNCQGSNSILMRTFVTGIFLLTSLLFALGRRPVLM